MQFLFMLFICSHSFGSISSEIVKKSALKHHPTVLSAIEKMRAGEEAVVGARGSFDAKVVSDYKRQTKDIYRTTISRTQLEKPLRFANSKIYVGSEQISNPQGILAPIYNTANPTEQTGNYSLVGAKVSLWKNLFLDPDRAALKNAKFDAKIARQDKILTTLDISRLGQLAYWQWVTANKIKKIYEELLKNSEVRNEYLVARNLKGDIGKIIITENEQYIASRKGSLQVAKERLIRAEYALSLFYRNENGEPIIPTEGDLFEDYPSNLSSLIENLDIDSNIDELIKKRPDIRNLELTIEKADVDLELARQDLKPKVDISTEYFKRTINHPNMPQDYFMVLAQINVPIERNLGNGNIAAARARRSIAEKEMGLGKETFKFEIMSLRRALFLQLEQVNQSQIEFDKSKELVVAETYKFKTGGGNLFLVNLREEAQANAEASFHESRLAFMDTLLRYQALTSVTD